MKTDPMRKYANAAKIVTAYYVIFIKSATTKNMNTAYSKYKWLAFSNLDCFREFNI